VLVVSALNERTVLRFSAAVTNWVENASAGLGRFGTNDFAIFTVHKSSGGNTTVMSKGTFGGSRRWEIGVAQNQFRWNSTNFIGKGGTDVLIRSYQRVAGTIFYYENGVCCQTNSVDGMHDVSSTDKFYVGRRGTESWAMNGDIAEIIIYTGTVSSVANGQITTYLGQKWLGWIPATPRGTPYEWLEDSGITEDHDSVDEGDLDGDGFAAWQEYLAGTDPLNEHSFLYLTGLKSSGNGTEVSWYGAGHGSSVPWSMYISTNLSAGWMLAESNSIARNPQNGINSWLDTSASNAPVRFYRPAVLVP
jgi:hypothetical protein